MVQPGRKNHFSQQAIAELFSASETKQVLLQNNSDENMFFLHVHFHVNWTYFHMKGFQDTHYESKAPGNSEIAYLPGAWPKWNRC